MITKKLLGQHFLKCRWVTHQILRAADISKNDTVLEVGPGAGALTFALTAAAGRVIAVEKDERLAEELKTRAGRTGIKNLEIITGDILNFLPQTKFGAHKVLGNIPYYLTSRLLRLLISHPDKPERIVFTIQKEVARRITARPPRMNLLALSVRAFGKPEIVKAVPASCFSPKPKIDSAIIKISDISNRYFETTSFDQDFFFKVAAAAFAGKRKMLTTTLSKMFPKNKVVHALDRAHLPLTARPEQCSLDQWRALITALQG